MRDPEVGDRIDQYHPTELLAHGGMASIFKAIDSESGAAVVLKIGTWSAAAWAIGFYEKNGYQVLSRPEIERLLRKYWSIPERQIETSVVLAKATSRSEFLQIDRRLPEPATIVPRLPPEPARSIDAPNPCF